MDARAGLSAIFLSNRCCRSRRRYRNEPTHDLTAERLFERRWATVLLGRVLTRLESEAIRAEKSKLFTRLRPLLEGEDLPETYKAIGASLGMSEGAQISMAPGSPRPGSPWNRPGPLPPKKICKIARIPFQRHSVTPLQDLDLHVTLK